ncbi:sulfotransferase family 2 domain-containing protein [Thioclava sp. GXIMD4215]|uniref:sulfotransferase family 2 domain-containing protein n=1 Tax=Thioclava sp. GXIMD4215 TaxID=3131928 RepID=UPI00311B007B
MSRSFLYIHVPKCGGTSFGAALRLAFWPSQGTIDIDRTKRIAQALEPQARDTALILADYAVRRVELAQMLERNLRCISAHVQFNADLVAQLAPERACVSLLREPVARFLSHYAYVQRRHPDPARADLLEAFLETEPAQRFGSQYLYYFAGTYQHHSAAPAADVARACQALEGFALVGFLDEGAAFRAALRRLAGRPLLPLSRNKRPDPAPQCPPHLRARIEDICAPDLAIYRHIRAAAQGGVYRGGA